MSRHCAEPDAHSELIIPHNKFISPVLPESLTADGDTAGDSRGATSELGFKPRLIVALSPCTSPPRHGGPKA